MLAVEPDDGAAPLVAQFAAAITSIDYVPFTLNQPSLLQALSNARTRGVQVRVLLEPHPEKDGEIGALSAENLRGLGITVLDANPAFALTHAKYAVIDGTRALILTFNSTTEQLATDRDFAVIDDDPSDVHFVQGLFDADWQRQPLGVIPPGFAVSPDNSNKVLTDLVASATQTLDVYAEKLLESPLLDAIVAAPRRNVRVRILAAPADPKGQVANALRQAEQSGRFEVKFLRRPKIHAKVMVIDGATVFLGSENVQDGAKDQRRELGIMFGVPDLASRISAIFETDWAASADLLR
jgi:cardiolipin synthase